MTLVVIMVCAVSCLAHPMGNFSINHYSGIHVERDAIEVRYIIDIAEIPTYQEIQNAGIVARVGDATLRPYLAQQVAAWEKGLQLEVNGAAVSLTAGEPSVIFPPGAGGLPTMKIGVVYRGRVPRAAMDGQIRLHYTDGNYEGHAGWKEIVVTTGNGVTIAGAHPFGVDRSAQLTDYPTNLLNSPPQDLEADLTYSVVPLPVASAKAEVVSAPVSAAPASLQKIASVATASAQTQALRSPTPESDLKLEANKQATPRNRFTELMARPGLGLGFLLTAAFLAAGLGAMHALEPGHGKTIVAAYLVGSRGKTQHAVGLGLLVTAAHTAGVYLLGAVVLYASKYVIPEQIYPWLSIFSGLVIAVMAVYLLLRAWTGVREPEEIDGLEHTHWYSRRRSADDAATLRENRTVSLRELLLLGITGGIIPCPAALVVLLSAVSLHRIGLGLFLIVCFSLGLATVLIAIGIAMVRARSLLSRWRSDSPWIQRWIPMASATAMLVAGLAIAATALPATGISFSRSSLTDGHVGSFVAIVVLGLVLGMRHSTDPDHVVAVSTIVSRERSVKQGAVIGMMWGFGHTLTIFIVGALIILFNLTIPPRVGLSMEMAVAAMLILLGVLNLTGVLRKLTDRFTPQTKPDELMEDEPKPSGFFGRMLARFGYYQLLRPLAIGLVHGLAGSAAVALLVLSMIHSPAWAIAYLVVFGLGTVAGMMLMTTVMAIPMALTGQRSTKFLTTASGLVSVCFGLFLVYHLGFVDGLFTSHVHWTPE